MRKTRIAIIIFALVTAIAACAGIAVFYKESQSKTPCKLVMVYSFSKTDKGYGTTRTAIVQKLKDAGFSPTLREIYLNSGHVSATQSDKMLYDSLTQYEKWNPDLIMAKGDQALSALLKSNNLLTRTKPVIFHGAHFPDLNRLKSRPNFSGYWDKPEFWKNMLLVKQLLGRVFIDINYSKTNIGQIRHKRLMEELEDKKVDIRLTHLQKNDYINDAYWDSSMVRTCPNADIYLNVVPLPNMTGQGLIHHFNTSNESNNMAFLIAKFEYSTHIVSGFYNAPIFTCLHEGFGEGLNILGGFFTNEQTLVNEWADMAAQTLRTKQLHKQTIINSAKQYNMDYELMNYWRIPADKLPADTLLYNVPFYARYQSILLLVGVAALLLLIYGLYHLRFVRRKTLYERRKAESIQKDIDEIIHSLEQSDTITWNISKKGTIHLDATHRVITHANKDDYSYDEFIQLIDEEDRERVLYNLNHIYNTATQRMEARLLIDGTPTWYVFRYSILKDPKNGVFICGLLENIENRKQRERELIEARKVAEEAEKKQSFLENLNHEIRTPLNAIVGFSNIICNDTDEEIDEKAKEEYIRTVNKNNDILMALIRDILEISRIDSGYTQFTFEDVPVTTFLTELQDRAQGLVKPGLKLIILKEDLEGFIIHVDKPRLFQTFNYLLTNANKFTQMGHIAIHCWVNTNSKEMHMAVADTGCGIARQHQKIIFSRFYKGDSFTQGTGLGLSICESIVQKLHGRIEVESTLGKGSTFTVILPYTEA